MDKMMINGQLMNRTNIGDDDKEFASGAADWNVATVLLKRKSVFCLFLIRQRWRDR